MEQENLKQKIMRHSFWSFISTTLSRIGALIFTIILARFLMPENYGIYSLVLSTAIIFYTFADLGVNRTFLRYLSSAIKKNQKQIPSYYRYLIKLKFILAASASLLLLTLSYPLSFYFFKNPNLFHPFLVSSFYIFVMSIDGFYSEIFFRKKNF